MVDAVARVSSQVTSSDTRRPGALEGVEVVVHLIPHSEIDRPRLRQVDRAALTIVSANPIPSLSEVAIGAFPIGAFTGPPSPLDSHTYSPEALPAPRRARRLRRAVRTGAALALMVILLLWSLGQLGSSVADLARTVGALQ